ncbi:MAG: RNase P modulator RnpM [Bacillota bacterium]
MRKRRTPERLCVGCRTMRPKRELLRVVRTPEGEVLLDPTGKKSGRGAYICPSAACLEQALKGDRLGKALDVTIGQDVADALRASIVERER